MYKKILVPLDGSKLAECVLPHVATVIKGCQAPDVVLLRVVEPFMLPATDVTAGGYIYSEATIKILEDENAAIKKQAAEYLKTLASGPIFAGATVDTAIYEGRAAEIIADFAAKNNIDLIIIATHGRSGVSRWVWGSTADKVLRSSCVPVFMVRAPGCVPGI